MQNIETVECDLCRKPMDINTDIGTDPLVMQLASGLIYYPEHFYGSYNGAEVHMRCAVNYQQYAISEGFVTF